MLIVFLMALDLTGLSFLESCARKTKTLIYPLDYQEIVTEYAGEYGLEPALIMAMIKVESNYVPDAYSGKASGLMQLTDDTAQWVANQMGLDIGEIDLMNPEDSIKLGCYYIRYLIDYYDGNVNVALAAYNGGMGNVNLWLQNKEYSADGKALDYIPYKETRDYVKKVNREKGHYEDLLADENITK